MSGSRGGRESTEGRRRGGGGAGARKLERKEGSREESAKATIEEYDVRWCARAIIASRLPVLSPSQERNYYVLKNSSKIKYIYTFITYILLVEISPVAQKDRE